jgi:hypothetical protein
VVGAAALAVMLALTTSSALASSVTPRLVTGNTSCTAQGYDFGFKPQPEPPPSGTYTIPGTTYTVTIQSDGTFFNWTSTLGIDAVIVKGGPNSNVYEYDPESFGDTGLHSPNNEGGQQAAISHIEFCFDFELTVSKTADTSFTRTFNWTIDKSVTPDTWDLFKGDSGTSEYTVTLTKSDPVDSDWAVAGDITIANNTPFDATIASVTDVVSVAIAADVDCGVTFPHTLDSGDTLVCSYETDLPDGTSRTNTATVTTTGDIGGGTATVPVTFGEPTTVVNDTINVTDSVEGDLGPFNASGSTTYSHTFTCDGDEGQHDNTATIDETGASDSASVTVNCYDLAVTKDAATAKTKTWTWTVDKTASATSLTLADGQLFPVTYTVTFNATSAFSDFAVSGNIHVKNPAPIDATINGVSDIVSPAITGIVDCGVTFPYTLVAGDTLECTYTADLPDASNRTNTATATLQNHSYDKGGNATDTGTTDFTGSANVSFANAVVNEVDECIDVADTNVGTNVTGTVCANEIPKTFTYTLDFGKNPDADVQLVCGPNTHTNTASFVTNDTDTTGSDDATVTANVACQTGCTLTPGYWKTHSVHGPAPTDDAWFALGDVDHDGTSEGADETFFNSGKTYYQVLWTAPQGNAYYILANAYIAAKLNILNGASAPSGVTAAITSAETFFNSKTPTSSLTKAERNAAIALATTLDNYNNGLTGPGHCSE